MTKSVEGFCASPMLCLADDRTKAAQGVWKEPKRVGSGEVCRKLVII